MQSSYADFAKIQNSIQEMKEKQEKLSQLTRDISGHVNKAIDAKASKITDKLDTEVKKPNDRYRGYQSSRDELRHRVEDLEEKWEMIS